ncbi:hypothetical protein [Nocardioides plantarum]|uniref:Uncharacterized protein n=1 Tax=Nocardioides plantarum TaxID=29299 RepID=A0ABV5KG17_9ACTN|nr:hypothetical protein [Nocardioides plantarum]
MNDDRLTADLHEAFRAATADLTYDRPAPRLRRTPAYAVPAAAAGLVAAGVATAVLLPSLASSPPRDVAAPEVTTGPPTTGVAAAVQEFVVDRVSFAGTTYVARRDNGQQGRLVARDVGTLPAGAEPVKTSVDAKAWFGEEPSTGDPALFVKAPTRYDGSIFSLSGAGWTQEQLVAVLEGGEPEVVPHVG